MAESLVPRLDTLRPEIKARWTALLRAETAAPAATTALIRPEMLVFMLDDTLTRLSASLEVRAQARRPPLKSRQFRASHAGCACGLHLLLTYYVAGARSLHTALPMGFGRARREILRYFNSLARQDMTALCDVCRQRGGPHCRLREQVERLEAARLGGAVSPPAAASPATPSGTGRSPGGTPG